MTGDSPHPAASGVTPLGAVFLSYRTSDGKELASRMAWALRAAGAPVWHDQTDLPPGDTRQRLREALASGISAAVLLVTPEIERSEVIRDVEMPKLLELHRDPAFTLAVGSTLEAPPGSGNLDYKAPDRLLGTGRVLATVKQYRLSGGGACEKIAKEIVLRRMKALRPLGQPVLEVDLQTRSEPRAELLRSGLVVRTRPPDPGHRAPSPAIWRPLQSFLGSLPLLVDMAGAREVLLRGGAHLTAAFSFGAALPSTARWAVAVEDQSEQVWRSGGGGETLELAETVEELGSPGRPVAVLVDLVPTNPPTDAFGEYVEARPGEYAASSRIVPLEKRRLQPADAGGLVAGVARRVRDLASRFRTNQVHLFLRTSFPFAVLLGRELNTLELTLYEWEDGLGRPHYLPAVTVASGRGSGPVVAIHEPA